MNAKAVVLISLTAAGCSSVREDLTTFCCEAAVRRISPEEMGDGSGAGTRPALYFVEFRIDRIDAGGAVVQEIARPTATVVEDQCCVLKVAGEDPLATAVEAAIIVPNESVSKEAFLQFRVTQDDLTVWAEVKKVPVAGRATSVSASREGDIREVLATLALEADVNLVIPPDVRGAASLVFHGPPTLETIKCVAEEGGFSLVRADEDSAPVFRVVRTAPLSR